MMPSASQRQNKKMKTTLQQKNLTSRDVKFPVTDFNYHHAATLPFYHGGRARMAQPSFRNISRHYFSKEARAEFLAECVAFGAIVLTAAIPLVGNARALADFLRAISGS